MLRLSPSNRSVPEIFQFICSCLAVPLINFSNFEKFGKMFTISCSLILLTNQNAHEWQYSSLICPLTGSCESFEEPSSKFWGTAKPEQMNLANIFGTFLLPRLYKLTGCWVTDPSYSRTQTSRLQQNHQHTKTMNRYTVQHSLMQK